MKQIFNDFDNIQTQTWGWGVFYATDSNSVDGRCRWKPDYNGYDCPGGWIPWAGNFQADTNLIGAGSYPAGNPLVDDSWGGGTGCHFQVGDNIIDQTPAVSPGKPLADKYCQCNYDFKNDWDNWVATWIAHGTNVRKDDGWFAGGKSPGHGLDQVACWVNNPRDMVNFQNHMYLRRYDWSNQVAPTSKWDNTNPSSLRVYWGWNEIPVSRKVVRNEQLRDAVMIKLPAGICGGKE